MNFEIILRSFENDWQLIHTNIKLCTTPGRTLQPKSDEEDFFDKLFSVGWVFFY